MRAVSSRAVYALTISVACIDGFSFAPACAAASLYPSAISLAASPRGLQAPQSNCTLSAGTSRAGAPGCGVGAGAAQPASATAKATGRSFLVLIVLSSSQRGE